MLKLIVLSAGIIGIVIGILIIYGFHTFEIKDIKEELNKLKEENKKLLKQKQFWEKAYLAI